MKHKIRGQEFVIDFVNNYVREKYADLNEKISDLLALADDLADKNLKEVRKEIKSLKREVSEIRYAIVKELLETNGYEFDKHFWLHKTDIDDMNNFMIDCLKKDLSGTSSKKK